MPVCDRCHRLKHHTDGVPIIHPSIDSIEASIFESPHKYNHIYHIVDAADFPMSVLPDLHRILNITPQRSLNRRSKSGKFYNDKKTEVSFIITRSDLLAPLKRQVDGMMPYLTEVLRSALVRQGDNVRLGNVRCVSASRNWWTGELKEEIWNRGGGGWMVGKVNVGKSRLFEEVFPKGRKNVKSAKPHHHPGASVVHDPGLDPDSLLPPLRAETNYPAMPLVSALPGTTASPIRIPYGSGKGELIDLPGIERSSLADLVEPQHRESLVMRKRIVPVQQVMRCGRSILLSGIIRITPRDANLDILTYNFTPLESHLTSTEKAIGIQTRTRTTTVENIGLPHTAEKIQHAGTFHLKWDVTRPRTGPLTARHGVGLKPEQLPYRVMATDLLIEGVGWVELVAQVRKRPLKLASDVVAWDDCRPQDVHDDRDTADARDGDVYPWTPEIDVFTPNGAFVAARKPMNAWLHIASKPVKKSARPRKSMKGAKKRAKALHRSEQSHSTTW